MTLILVAGSAPAAGASTVAVGLAHRLAFSGHNVRLARLAGDDRAASDAAAFGSLDFADSTGMPVEAPAAGALPATRMSVIALSRPESNL